MPDVKMPDGTIIRNVPEGTTKAQLQARYDKAKAGDASSDYNKTNLSQGLSGLNEGIGNILGAPVDITNAALNLGARGINALTGSNIQMSDRPFLGSKMINEAMGRMGAIGPETVDADNRFVRRTMQSVGSAMVPVAATASAPAQIGKAVLPALTGGMGAAGAQQMFPGDPFAEFAGEMLGSGAGLGGVYRSMANAAKRKAAEAVPDIPQLKQQANRLYDAAQANGVTATQQQTSDLYQNFRKVAKDEGLISPTGRISTAYPKAKEALDLAKDYSKGMMNPRQMKTVRKVLSEAAASPDNSERRLAKVLLGEFDDWTSPLAPEFAEARKVSARYLGAQTIQDAIERAGVRAGQFSGSGFENALRTEFRALDRKIVNGQERGFSSEAQKAIRDVARGTKASNAARNIGKLAPTGVVSAGISTGVPFAIGNAAGGPAAGAALSGLTSAVGMVGRRAATKMTADNAKLADLIVRNGGLPKALPAMSARDRAWVAGLLGGQLSQYVTKKQK